MGEENLIPQATQCPGVTDPGPVLIMAVRTIVKRQNTHDDS